MEYVIETDAGRKCFAGRRNSSAAGKVNAKIERSGKQDGNTAQTEKDTIEQLS